MASGEIKGDGTVVIDEKKHRVHFEGDISFPDPKIIVNPTPVEVKVEVPEISARVGVKTSIEDVIKLMKNTECTVMNSSGGVIAKGKVADFFVDHFTIIGDVYITYSSISAVVKNIIYVS